MRFLRHVDGVKLLDKQKKGHTKNTHAPV